MENIKAQNREITSTLKGLDVGEKSIFPVRQTASIRSIMYRLNYQFDKEFTSKRKERLLEVTRTK